MTAVAYWSIFGAFFLQVYFLGYFFAVDIRVNPGMIASGARALPLTVDSRKGGCGWAWSRAVWWPVELVCWLVWAIGLGLVCLGLWGLGWLVLLAGGVESRMIDLLDAVEERFGVSASAKPSKMEEGPE